MGIESINEPGGRTTMVLPASINEPPKMPDAPVITALNPSECTLGDPDFTLFIEGTGFYPASMIIFAGHDEPTTLNEDGTLSTGINMALWQGPDTVKVQVYNGPMFSNEADFTFNAAGATRSKAHAKHVVDPDDLEEQIEEAAEDDDFKSTHPTRKKRR
jgi:hypothetical protein